MLPNDAATLPGLTHFGLVVEDMDKAAKAMSEMWGIGSWTVVYLSTSLLSRISAQHRLSLSNHWTRGESGMSFLKPTVKVYTIYASLSRIGMKGWQRLRAWGPG